MMKQAAAAGRREPAPGFSAAGCPGKGKKEKKTVEERPDHEALVRSNNRINRFAVFSGIKLPVRGAQTNAFKKVSESVADSLQVTHQSLGIVHASKTIERAPRFSFFVEVYHQLFRLVSEVDRVLIWTKSGWKNRYPSR